MAEIETHLIDSYDALWSTLSEYIVGGWALSGLALACGVQGVAAVTFQSLSAILAGHLIGYASTQGDYSWGVVISYCALQMANMFSSPYGFVMAAVYIVHITKDMLEQRAKRVYNPPQERLDDVVPLGMAKEKIEQLVAYLRDPEPFLRIGAKPPQGVLLIGPPGTGKTLLAKALSNEIGPYTTFIETTGSQLQSKWVGESAERVRELFAKAKENARTEQERLDRDCLDEPTLSRYRGYCVIFIDEIDSFGSRKYNSNAGEGLYQDSVITINEMLAQMDGFDASDSILVIGTTNDSSRLDPAILSRFNTQITTELPNLKQRMQIFEKHLEKARMKGMIKLDELAEKTPGLSGRDIKNITEAALWNAAIKKTGGIDQNELLCAIEEFIADRPLSLGILDRELAFS